MPAGPAFGGAASAKPIGSSPQGRTPPLFLQGLFYYVSIDLSDSE